MSKKIGKTDLRRLQEVEVEILDEIVRICNKHNLEYFLIGGTCLGAIRHKGFIPWDDDIDIAMPRDDYEKFIDIAIKELKDDYFIQCNKTDKLHYLGYIKIRKNNTTFSNLKDGVKTESHLGFFVDIFPLDYTNDVNSLSLRINITLAKNLTETMIYKKKYKKFFELRHPLISAIGLPFNIQQLQKIVVSLMKKHNKREHKYVGVFSGAYFYKKDTFPIDKVFPALYVTFEGKKYKTFNDSRWYLEHLYGDYMKLPDEKDRVSHNPKQLLFDEGKNLNSLDEFNKNKKNGKGRNYYEKRK